MAIAPQPVLNQIIADVQYTRGFAFLDKCGSMLHQLEDALGKPFEGDVTSMDHGELRNGAERVVVTYGSKNFNVNQAWADSPVRVEHLAPIGWELVSTALGVQKTVQRVGARFVYLWKVDSLEEGHAALTNCGLFSTAAAWQPIFGDGSKPLSWTVVVEDPRGRVRIVTDVIELTVQGGQLPADLVPVVPKYAIALDMDHTHPGKGPFSLTKGELKDFMRTAWQRTREAGTLFRRHLGDAHAAAD